MVEFYPVSVSNTAMALQTQHITLLLKIFVIIFTLNSTIGYAAFADCCEGMGSDAQSEVKMPCHDESDETPSMDSDKCCSACITVVLTSGVIAPQTALADNGVPTAIAIFIPQNFAPPFRPPIIIVS